jgi:hypothetical protein
VRRQVLQMHFDNYDPHEAPELVLNTSQAIVVGASFGATATKIHVDPIPLNPHRALWMRKHTNLCGQSSMRSMSWGVFKVMLRCDKETV